MDGFELAGIDNFEYYMYVCYHGYRSNKESLYGWTAEEEEDLLILQAKFEADGLMPRPKDKQNLRQIMKARHLVSNSSFSCLFVNVKLKQIKILK